MNAGHAIIELIKKIGSWLEFFWGYDFSPLTEPLFFGISMLDIIAFFAFIYCLFRFLKMVWDAIETTVRESVRTVVSSIWHLVLNTVTSITRWFFRRVFATIEYLTGKAVTHTWRHRWQVRYERFRALFQKPEEGWSFFPKQSPQNSI